ncbi:MAG: TAT-variant-translocated molybdopterin oxidoreductase [Bacteroidota bacterium]
MNTPKYWRGLDEREQTPEFLAEAKKEFPTGISIEDALNSATEESTSFRSNRRDFLKVFGFGLTAATLAACDAPLKKAIPYVNKPDSLIPGVANYYASTTATGVPVLVKTREGRPIMIEGNPDSASCLSAGDHASVLDLYDIDRLRGPRKGAENTTWDTLNGAVRTRIQAAVANGGGIRVLSNTILSPTKNQIITDFLTANGGTHVTYDPISTSALAKAHEIGFGSRVIPTYHFDRAQTIISFACDFLGTWPGSDEYNIDYTVNRDPDKPMSRHLQFESLMSLTGANADLRFPLNPSDEGVALLNLYNKVLALLGKPTLPAPSFNVAMNGLDKAAQDLVAAKGASLVVCGTNDVASQIIVAAINDVLGNYGKTLDIDNPSYYRKGNDEDLDQLAKDLESGNIDVLIVVDADPVYDTPYGDIFKNALGNLGLSLAMTNKANETSNLCQFTAVIPHYLEAWGDAQQSATQYSLRQPTIRPLFNSRPVEECFLNWTGDNQAYTEYLKNWWETNLYPLRGAELADADFYTFWVETLRKGVMSLPETEPSGVSLSVTADDLMTYADLLKAKSSSGPAEGEFDLVFFESMSIRDGKQANNPWLQELPDPIAKVTWDQYVSVPYSYARENNLKNEDLVKIEFQGNSLYMPVIVQAGQAKNTLGIPVGYGRVGAGRVAVKANGEKRGDMQIAGTNVYPFGSLSGGGIRLQVRKATVSRVAGQTYPLALTQTFNTLYDPVKGLSGDNYDRTERIIEETTYANYNNGKYKDRVHAREERKKHLVTLWDSHYEDPEESRSIHWKMAIDLNKCTGCGSCIVACQAENNVPVVGKEEVRKRRGMYWMRIDRYYSGNAEMPDVVFQPMMCQHCDNAPCETVCPVLATIHSDEGLNQMAYNRCVGTRYCANNCPYKVRRFNWFNYYDDEEQFGDFYTHNDLGRLVLNPDVTVRFRGVMEKCSFCVQRLQDAKLRKKLNANSSFAKIKDGDIKTACQQSCGTGAIIFGDFNDPESAVSKAYREERSYAVLEDIKTLPSVQYQALVRNRTEEETKAWEEMQKPENQKIFS